MSENQFEGRSGIRPFKSFYDSETKSDIDVYIVRRDQVDEAEKIRREPDVIVVDDRRSSDPNMQVRRSYKITNQSNQSAIVQILLDYNAQFPTNPPWKRTRGSLLQEWALHNIAYMLGVQPERTGDVDFNNGDEGKHLRDFLKGM